ncbi:MAG: HAMP domain-containing sensor histidine kinase [Candidatus Faecousia sp.]|nr:HAMP domain-containing sensor histidine kinase [Candidatus Faecousia sp.]
MKHHVVVKFLAIVLCALCLMTALVSGGSLLALMSMDLGEDTSPYQGFLQSWQANLEWYAPAIAGRYAASHAPNADEELLDAYYGYLNPANARLLQNMNYELLDSKGKELERKADQKGNFTDFTIQVPKGDGTTYPEVLSGPVHVETAEELYAVCRELAGKNSDEEEMDDLIGNRGRMELSDGKCVYDVASPDGWNVYLIREVPLDRDYTVVLHKELDDDAEIKALSVLDGVWRHQTQVVALLGGSLVLFGLLAVYLCCAAGHKPGQEEIRPSGLNCVPLDLYLGVWAALALVYAYVGLEGIRYLLRQSNSMVFAYYGYGGYLVCLVFVGFCFACAAQFKTPGFYWWHHSLTGLCWRIAVWCWHFGWKCLGWAYRILWSAAIAVLLWMKKVLKKIGRFLAKAYRLLPLTWQWLLVGFVLVGCLLLSLEIGSLPLLWGSVLGTLAVMIYGANAFGTLLEAAKRMRSGDLDVKVDEKWMLGAFQDFAVEMNGLNDVVLLAAQKQMRSERMRTELITNVSHDIKTPLTSIINYVDLLQKPHTEEEGKSYLEVLSRQSGRMKKLIDDLIELSKASTGNIPVELTKVDAVEAVNQALGEFTDKLTAAELTPVFRQPEEPLFVHADGRLAWRAMSNLLSNAVKYAQPGTRFYIDMVALDGKVCISFKNISRAALNVSAEELMERFVRGEASRNQEGSGLGLNIAKSMMELQHGDLDLLVDGDLFKATLVFPQETEA